MTLVLTPRQPDHKTYYGYVNKYTGESQWEIPRATALHTVGQKVIFCQLIDKIPLTSMYGKQFRYSTLSYCAGSRHEVAEILVNGRTFNAFKNLEHALDCTRRYWRKTSSEELLIWVDQICINQSDYEEKSFQVAMMREIYRGCRQVFACLSTHSSPTLTADLQACRHFLADNFPGARELLNKPSSPLTPSCSNLTDQDISLSTQASYGPSTLMPFLDMISATWWTRAWVFQEIMLPARSLLLFGPFCANWREIGPLLSFLCHHEDDIKNLKSSSAQRPIRNSSKSHRKSHRYSAAVTDLTVESPFSKRTSSTANESVNYILDAKMSWKGSSDLRTVVENLHRFSATDPRDLVFAFLGLISPGSGIEPDYSPDTTLHHVFISVAQSLIRKENKLDILEEALRSNGEYSFQLPGWVPDWTGAKSAVLQIPGYIKVQGGEFRASKDTDADAGFHVSKDDRMNASLHVTGIQADVLAEIIQDFGDQLCFRSQRGRLILTSDSAQFLDTVWVLFGAGLVYVLRREEQTDCYALVSTAICLDETKPTGLSDIMYGELVDLYAERRVEAQRIEII